MLKGDQIWDCFFTLALLNGGRRGNAALTGVKQRQGGKGAQRRLDFSLRIVLFPAALLSSTLINRGNHYAH